MKFASKLAAKAKSAAGVLAAVGATSIVAGNAAAGDLATAVTGALDASEMTLIGVGVLALTGIVVLIKKAQRAAGG